MTSFYQWAQRKELLTFMICDKELLYPGLDVVKESPALLSSSTLAMIVNIYG